MVGVVLCVAAAVTGASSAQTAGASGSYGFDAGARRIDGGATTADAGILAAGTTYRSSLPVDGKLSYGLQLDTDVNAYVSVTAVPGAGTTVSATDGIKVSVQDDNGRSCSIDTASVGTERRPHPLTALGVRDVSRAGSRCRDAGTYYVLVERVHREGSSADAWDLELATVSEPRLEHAGTTSAPEAWNSTSPEPVTGETVARRGGSGFAEATPVGEGTWRTDIQPGETLFYAVPVDWGRQVYASAELASTSGDSGIVPRALVLSLYNPVRGHVTDEGVTYDGSQKTAALDPLPPVEYANRYDTSERVSGMRFAGSYYLVVHLSEQVADRFGEGPYALTLRVRVAGAGADGPGYAGESRPWGVFDVAGRDRGAGTEGGSGAGSSDVAMRLLAAGGIGTGTALLMGLGVWTVLGRRRGA